MSDGTGLAEALLGLSGFRVLEVTENDAEVVIDIETVSDLAGCAECGVRAEAQDRTAVEIRDLACFGRAARLVWRKRRWRCADTDCEAKTWTEISPHISARTVLTQRAGWEACRQVGANARPVAGLARELGVCWSTIMGAVIEHGQPLVDDPDRVGAVTNLGVDETWALLLASLVALGFALYQGARSGMTPAAVGWSSLATSLFAARRVVVWQLLKAASTPVVTPSSAGSSSTESGALKRFRSPPGSPPAGVASDDEALFR